MTHRNPNGKLRPEPEPLVHEFHRAFGLPILEAPTIPDAKRVALRLKLIQEEYKEVMAEFEIIQARSERGYASASVAYQDIARLAKELSDLQYVVEGCAAEFGIPLRKVYEEVHRSNMSKLGPDGKPIRRHDGKVLKGPNYREADVLSVLGILEGDTSP